MHSRDANTAFANALVDEWARAGVEHAVICPGSRSTPLALALVRDVRLRSTVILDERSAAFYALGIGKATDRPAVLVCTSGTAAANFHPAVIEAHHGRVPLLVCTADRPPELRGVGAPQTIEQARLYGDAVRWFHEPGPPADEPGANARWRTFACRAVAAAVGSPPGPVHCNLPFREPLVPTGEPLVDASGRADGLPWVRTTRAPLGPPVDAIDAVRDARRGVIVAGFGADDEGVAARAAETLGWPLLADAVSNARRGPNAVAYEALVRSGSFLAAHTPDVVVRVGAPLTSKAATAWLDRFPTVLVDPYDEWLDPSRAATTRVVAEPGAALDAVARSAPVADDSWITSWQAADAAAREAIHEALDADEEVCEAQLVRQLLEQLPADTQLAVASSLPVRAVEWMLRPRDDITIHANRGANGIDGFVSTVLGIASIAPAVALLGDLCFLHDANGLLGAVERGIDATFVVIDNRGGGIFGYLPQRDLPEFEALFATPQPVDLAAVARAYGANVERVTDVRHMRKVIEMPGVNVVIVEVDRAASARKHERMWSGALQTL
jgi:2-succinyl-5-enolpyruvyl-6-hydroxy-3-cyclohexene-1-carboxylate synthase